MISKEINKFINKATCLDFINKFEKTGDLDIDFEVGNDKYARHDFRDRNLRKILFECFLNHSKEFIEKENIVDISNLFYVSKYFPGNSIDWHLDGHRECDGMKSNYSFVIYLNDNFDGGETSIKDKNGVVIDVKPDTGKVLILNQDIMHCGKQVKKGIKYILRGDLMSYVKKCSE